MLMRFIWRFSSAGRAPALQAGGQRFDPVNLHIIFNNLEFSIIFIDEININKFLILCQYINFSQILTFLYSVCTLKTAYHNPKLGQVLDLLVLLS